MAVGNRGFSFRVQKGAAHSNQFVGTIMQFTCQTLCFSGRYLGDTEHRALGKA